MLTAMSASESLLIKLGMLAGTAVLVWWIGWPTTEEDLPDGPGQPPAISGATNPAAAESVAAAAKHVAEPRPSVGQAPAPAKGRARVDLNRATVLELQTLPGIGEVLAKRIDDRRQTRGSFHSVEELLEVKGIGQKRLERLRPLLTIGKRDPRPPADSRERVETDTSGKTKL